MGRQATTDEIEVGRLAGPFDAREGDHPALRSAHRRHLPRVMSDSPTLTGLCDIRFMAVPADIA